MTNSQCPSINGPFVRWLRCSSAKNAHVHQVHCAFSPPHALPSNKKLISGWTLSNGHRYQHLYFTGKARDCQTGTATSTFISQARPEEEILRGKGRRGRKEHTQRQIRCCRSCSREMVQDRATAWHGYHFWPETVKRAPLPAPLYFTGKARGGNFTRQR